METVIDAKEAADLQQAHVLWLTETNDTLDKYCDSLVDERESFKAANVFLREKNEQLEAEKARLEQLMGIQGVLIECLKEEKMELEIVLNEMLDDADRRNSEIADLRSEVNCLHDELIGGDL